MKTALPEPVVAEMMGSGRHLPEPYRRYTEEELAGAYLRGEQAVTLHRSQMKESVTKKIADLERQVGILHEKWERGRRTSPGSGRPLGDTGNEIA